jgi:hypothetical protein
MRDDRILPLTRLVSACIPPFLIAAFVILYLFPSRTSQLFAWTIRPEMTPLLMGAGYIAGSYFFGRLVLSGRNGRWHHYSAGFLAITVFTWFMLAATLLHLDRFNRDHVSFFAWIVLYAVTPLLVPALWVYNQRTDAGAPDPDGAVVPDGVRVVAAVSGAAILAVAAFLFLAPESAREIWPWQVSPLTSRVLAGWFALPGTLGVALSRDPRWLSWRTLLESQGIGLGLILLGAARAWDDFDTARPTAWIFVAGIAALFAGVVSLRVVMESRRTVGATTAE